MALRILTSAQTDAPDYVQNKRVYEVHGDQAFFGALTKALEQSPLRDKLGLGITIANGFGPFLPDHEPNTPFTKEQIDYAFRNRPNVAEVELTYEEVRTILDILDKNVEQTENDLERAEAVLAEFTKQVE